MLASTALCAAGLTRAALAADAIWVGQSSDYNNATHWLPTGPPDGTASFNTGTTSISVGTTGSVGQWLFDGSVAVPWTFSISAFPPFTFNGAGITIGANAGTATLNLQPGAEVNFLNSSSAGTATINLTDDSLGTGSFLRFDGSSTAANATISLGSANANSFVAIEDTASGGSARFIVNGGGTLYISTLTSAGTTVGSIEGSGGVILGTKNLEVGSLNTDTEFSGVIATGGPAGGSLTKVGTGTLTLSGANTYDGDTTISAGALQIGNGGTTGSLAGNVVNNALLIFNRSDDISFGNVISGTGAVRKEGANTLTLTNTNTYTGGTTISAGTLQIGNGGTTGSIVGDVANDGLVIFNRSNASTYAGAISGSGAVQKSGAGTLTLTGANAYTGGTTINAGTLQIGSGGTAGSITGDVTNNGTLVFNRSDGISFGGVISGTGALQKDGAGTTTLTGTNTYAGGTTINAGTLQIGSGGTVGSITGNVTNNGTLAFNRSDDITFGDVISGNGGVTKAGAGRLNLTNTNTYAGATNINGGTLAITSDSNLGNGGALTFDGGKLLFANQYPPGTLNRNVPLTRDIAVNAGGGTIDTGTDGVFSLVTGGLSGTGNLTVTGTKSGGVQFSGPVTFTGGVTVKDFASLTLASTTPTTLTGPVSISAPTNSSDSLFAAGNFSNVSFSGSTVTLTASSNNFAEMSVSSGSFNNTAITLNGVNGQSGATAILTLSTGGTLGNSTVINNGGRIDPDGTSSFGSANITNNAGLVTGSNLGTAVFDNKAGALLQISNPAAAGATITNRSNASTSFAYGSSLVSPPGGLLIQGGVADNITITNKTGAAAIFFFGSAGTANITNEAGASVTFLGNIAPVVTASAGNATIANAGTLLFDANSTTGNANITTTGTVNLNTTDTTGAATVTVHAGGSLIGNGAIGNTTINAGGTLAPGHSIGTIAVNGNLTFNAGGIYAVEISPTAADRTNVTGSATLTGATVQMTALPGSFQARTYTVLNATGGVVGTFAGLTATGTSVRNPRLTYDATNVFLTIDASTLTLPPGTAGNQAGVAGGISNAVLNGAAPPAGFDTLLNLSGTQLTNALAQVSGEGGHGATQTASYTATNQFIGTMLDPSIDGRGDGGTGGSTTGYADKASDAMASAGNRGTTEAERDAYAAVTPREVLRNHFPARWSVWASGYGGSASVSGNATAGTHDTTSSIYGTAVGADHRIGRDAIVGFAMGGAGVSFNTAQGLGGGRADVFQVGVYGRYSIGAAYIAGALAYGWQDVTTNRTLTVAGTDHLRAEFNANTFAARVEAGHRFATPLGGVTPYGALQVTAVNLPDYAETAVSGSNQFALAFASQITTNLRTELGLRADKSFAVNGGIFTLRGRAAWAHDSNTDRAISPTFQSLPGASFTVNGAAPSPDGALVSAGAEMKWHNGWSLAGLFEGEFSRTTESYAGKGTVRYAW